MTVVQLTRSALNPEQLAVEEDTMGREFPLHVLLHQKKAKYKLLRGS